ncbi:hypothetical protein N431DRAFT_489471 [Stipitochalara longipes BDJ]|nr:hypothetical protein N431DRAFT_489471 [Stipitochalara longipes BDJ]
MRSLISAALVLAPALASALSVREVDLDHEEVGPVTTIDRLYTQINVDIPAGSRSRWSPDEWEADSYLSLPFSLQILKSEAACSYGKVTVDGQELPQTLNGDVSTGSGTFAVNHNTLIASWSFNCIKINGVPDSQFMKFVIEFIDGKALQNVGFSVLFRQSGAMEIMNIETDLSIPDQVAANPNPQALQPLDQDDETPEYNIDDDIAELQWMEAQLQELAYLIFEKKHTIRIHAHHRFEQVIEECDSLKCLLKTVAEKAKSAAHSLYGKIRGGHEDDETLEEEFDHPHLKKPHLPKLPIKKPHFPKPPFHGGKNCTGPPKWNHTRPGKPHFPHRPLPICRYPPPPHHGKPPHKPPHHGKPPGKPPGPPPEWAHEPDFHHGPDMDRPPPPEFNGPHHGEDHHGPPPPDFDEPHHGKGHHGPPHPDFDEPPHHGGGHDGPPGPPPDFEQERIDFPGDGPDGPGHRGPPRFDGPPPRGPRGLVKALYIMKFTAIGFLFAFLILALHRRACTPKRRADRQARREQRHRRRAYRRAVHKHAITRLLSRISGNESDSESDDYEEKRRALLSDAEDGMSTTMTEDITQLRNAAEVVGEIVSAEEDRSLIVIDPTPIPATETRPLMQDFETLSQVGDGEELPAYEDNDGSEASSFVADGFRYTPGSTEYNPSHSPAGSVSDILGPDTKS